MRWHEVGRGGVTCDDYMSSFIHNVHKLLFIGRHLLLIDAMR